MAENSQEQGTGAGAQPEQSPREGDRQSMLLKLAERTVLQAEALAQEITEHARQESEAEGAKILAEHTDRAQAEAKQTIEFAQSRSETILSEAAAEAISETAKTLKKAQSESEKMLAKAKSDSEKLLTKTKAESEAILSKARSESEGNLESAQTQSQQILARARDESVAIVNASQVRAESAESHAKLQAEFIIRQTTQNVSDGIRSAVLEICNSLLPTVEKIGSEALKASIPDQVDIAVAIETDMIGNGTSNGAEENASAPDPARNETESSDRPTGKKAKSPARSQETT